MNRILAIASFVLLLGFLGACRREERLPLPTPTIFQIDQLLLRAGDTLTITGEAFSPTAAANQVLFNGVAGRPVSGNLRTIRVIVPDGAGSGTLQVIRDGRASNRFPYEYEGRLELGDETEVLWEAVILPPGIFDIGISNFLRKDNGDFYVAFENYANFPTIAAQVNRYTSGSTEPIPFFNVSFVDNNFRGFAAMYITENNYQVYHYNNRYYARTQATGAATQLSGLELPTQQLFADANQNVYTTVYSSNAQQTLVVKIPNGTISGFDAEANIVAALPFGGFCFPDALSAIDAVGNIYMYTRDPCSSGRGSIHKISSPSATPVLLTNNVPSDDYFDSMFYLPSQNALLLFSDNGVIYLYNLTRNSLERYTVIPLDFEILHLEIDKDENLFVLGELRGGSFDAERRFQIRRLRIR